MSHDSTSRRFLSVSGKMVLSPVPSGKHMQPHLTYGVNQDLPDMFKTKHSLVRTDLPRSPVRSEVRPVFAYNEFEFHGNKEVFDYSSAKPTSTFDMRNSYRLDLKLKSPFYKEYKRTLETEGFARVKGMCTTIAELSVINHDSPILPIRNSKTRCKRETPVTLRKVKPKAKKVRPLEISFEQKYTRRLKNVQEIEKATEVRETLKNIEQFERALRNSLGDVKTKFFFHEG